MRWLLAFLLALSRAAAAEPCDIPEVQWECVGTVEFRVQDKLMRMTFYNNGDVLAEDDVGRDGTSMFLDKQKNEFHYRNLSDAMHSGKVRHPFQMFGEGAGMVVEMLRVGFPDGPSSVPSDDIERQIVLRGVPSLTVHARQAASGGILFRFDAPMLVTDGRYVAGQLPPQPADYEGRRWPVNLPPPPRKVAELGTVPKPSNVKK
jgi:hypothetical protein